MNTDKKTKKSTGTQFCFRLFPLLLCLLLFTSCNKETESDLPEGCLRAGNEAVDYTFCYEDTWELDRNDGMIAVKYNVGSGGTLAYASISAQAFELQDSNTAANDYWEQYRQDLEDLYGDHIQFTSEKEESSLGGVVANRNRYTLTLTDTTYSFEQIICIRNGTVYLLTFTVPEAGYSAAIECFETVISTFSFL